MERNSDALKEYDADRSLGKDDGYIQLIAGLGGYQEAQNKLRRNGSLHAQRLEKALLQYRQQNNTYPKQSFGI